MSLTARVSGGIAAIAMTGGVLLAVVPSAGAATPALAKPAAPHVNSATISGSEVLVSISNPTPPAGGSVNNIVFDNGRAIDPNQIKLGTPAQLGFPLSAAPAGSTITATVTVCVGDPDNGTQQCARSSMSNSVVVK
ncbi:MAG: hypothetical protein J2P17_25760 [Mycobacterium sp.]|nr:hypothetical protein [Mycobacterium sp.]